MSGTAYPFVVDLLDDRIRADDDVLELGCGGKVYRDLIPGRYVGLDLADSPYVDSEPPDIAASAEDVPAPDASFDVVFTVATLNIVPDAPRALAESHRLLRGGGRLIVFEYQRDVAQGLVDSHVDHHHAWDYAALRELIGAAGFGEVRDLSARVSGDTLVNGPRALVRRLLGRHTQWLVVEARA